MPDGGDDVTTGELGRNIQQIRETVDKRFDQLIAQLAGFVTMQLFQAEMASVRDALARAERDLAQAIAELRDHVDRETSRVEERISDGTEKGWRAGLALFGGVIGPIIVMIIAATVLAKLTRP